jgi:hypothetical protein
MPVPILTTMSTILCPHGGNVVLTTSDAQMKIQEAYALLITDVHTIAGCPFTLPPSTPSPCVVARWSAGAIQTQVNQIPVLLETSVGTCYSAAQAPQGVAVISQVQQIAKGL